MKAVSIKVYGRVQGVFFRASTLEEAQRLGLTGWCRNEPDGTVLIHAEGEDRALAIFANWCKKGPRWANVSRLETKVAENQGFSTFKIRR